MNDDDHKSELHSSSENELTRPYLELGNRLREIREDILGISRGALAAELGVSLGTLQNYEYGYREANLTLLMRLSELSKMPLEKIAYGDNKSNVIKDRQGDYNISATALDTLRHPVNVGEFVFIPRYNIRASAGHGHVWEEEQIIDTQAYRRDWIASVLIGAHPENLVAAIVSGDSMEPTLKHHDTILVDRTDTALNDDIYVLNLDGSVYVKRLQRLPDGCIAVISDNQTAFPAFRISADRADSLVIGGRVRAFSRTI